MKSILAAIVAAILSLFGHQPARYYAPTAAHAPAAQTAAAASFVSSFTPALITKAASTVSATTTVVNNYITEPVVAHVVPTPDVASPAYITQGQYNAGMLGLSATLQQLLSNIAGQAYYADATPPLGGGAPNTIAAASAIDQLSGTALNNVTVNGISGLTAADIPSLSGTYLPLAGGTLAGNIFVDGNATTTDLFAGNVSATNFSAQTFTATGTSTFAGVDLSTNCSTFGNGGKLTTDAFGDVVCAADQGGSGSTVAGSNDQIQFNGFGSLGASSALTFATSTGTLTAPNLFTTNASTSLFSNFGTAYFGGSATSSFNSAGQLTLGGIASSLLSTNATGQVVATTSIDTDYLTGALGIINGTSLTVGGGIAITAASSTLLSNNNTFTGTNGFTNATFTNSTSTSFAISNLASTLLAVNANGAVIATSTIGNSQLQNSSVMVNGTNIALGGSGTISAASSTLLANNNTWTGFQQFASASSTLTTLNTTWFNALNNAILSTNANGQVVATTSIGTNLLTGTLGVGNGGTGISSAPSAGNILVGNGSVYTLTATSSLGLLTTNVAEGTNLYFTNARAISALTGQNVSIFTNDTGYLTPAAFATDFDSRLFATTSLPSITTLAGLSLPYSQLTGTPSVTGYPFALSGNATSTLTQFNGGLSAFASTTIGNGNQNGGLTVNGGATTTGNLLVQGNATTTNLFSTTASSTNLFAQTAALVSLSLKSALPIASGGTNATSYTSGQLLSYNGTSFVSTTTIGNNQLANSSLTVSAAGGLSGGGLVSLGGSTSLSLDLTHANSWTGLQAFANASSTLVTFGTAWFSANTGTLLSTDSNGKLQNTAVAYPLQFSGSTLSTAFGTTTPNIFAQLQTFNGNASTTQLSATSAFFGGTATSTFSASGVLGLGTTSPTGSNELAVAGTSYFSGNVGIGSSTAGSLLSLAGGNFTQTPGAPTQIWQSTNASSTSSIYIQGHYAYVMNLSSGPSDMQIYDIANPASPTLVGTYFNTGQGIQDIAVSGKYAYIDSASQTCTGAAPSACGLVVLDVSNPSNPTFVGRGGSAGFAVVVSGKYAYTADGPAGGNSTQGLGITDISNPASPTLVGSVTFGASGASTNSLYVSGQYAYMAGGQDTGANRGLNIIDVSNPSAPVVVGTASTTGSAISIYVSGKYAYVGENGASFPFQVFDISNPTAPALVSTFTANAAIEAVYISGHYAYLGEHTTTGGIQVVDVSNPATPVAVASANLPVLMGMSFGHNLLVSGKYLYVGDKTNTTSSSFLIYDISGINSPSATIGNINTSDLTVDENTNIGGDLFLNGGLNLGPSGIFSRGGLSVYVASSTAANPIAAEFIGGNVGIGTTTPYSRLSIWGKDTGSTTALEVDNSASTTVFAVFDNGNATLAGSLIQNSDQRLKTNVQPLDGSSSLSAIDTLNPVTFNWIDPNKGTTPQLGFIAQQVLPIFPNLVSTTSPTAITPDGTLSVNYIGLIAPMVKAIQEIANITGAFQQNLIAWLGNAENGIADLFAQNIHAQSELCVGSTCVTPSQFQAMAAAASVSQSSAQASNAAPSSNANTPPIIEINGDNPAIIQVGETYNDLGATITGPQADLNLGIQTYLNRTLTSNIVIDTSEPATDTIDYVATDQDGHTSTSTRTLIIDPAAAPLIVPTDDASPTEEASTTAQ